MHSHYIFGALTFLLLSISFLPKKLLSLTLIIFSFLYLRPPSLNSYTAPAPHSVKEKSACIQNFCQQRQNLGLALEPIFINTHSSSHDHQALEYVFLLKKFGCSAIDAQEFNATPVNEMLVIADRAEFKNNETAYYELSQFGKAQEIQQIKCQPDLQLHWLKKFQ